MSTSRNEMSTKQKKVYIKRYVDNDVLNMETIKNIYKIIRTDVGLKPIRDSKNSNTPGVFIDLSKIDDNTIDKIYVIIQKHISSIIIT